MGITIVNIIGIIVQALANAYVILLITNKLSKNSCTNKKIFILLILALLQSSICTVVKNYIPGFNTIISIVFQTLITKFMTKKNLLKSFLIAIGVSCFFAITEIIAVYLTMFILKTSMDNLIHSPLKLLCTTILQFFVIVLIIISYYKITKTKPINIEFFHTITSKQIILFATLLMVYIFPQMILFVVNSYTYPLSILIINSIQFVLIFIISFILVKNIVGYQKSQTDLYISELHNKTLVGMVDGVRTLKHDYNNIMQALNGYVLTKQYDKLQDHINSLLKECSNVNNLAVIDPRIINDPAIYGIIGSKYFAAEEKNVDFEFDIVTNIAEINFSKPDLSRILGILLDNAIEASQKAEKPVVRLEMHFDKRKCADIIKVVNSYDTSININTIDIFKKGYSTKEVKSGIGLWEVKKLVNKNSNSQIFASIENGNFIQTLIIEKSDDTFLENIS